MRIYLPHSTADKTRRAGATMIDIVLVDSHKLVRDAIKCILEQDSEFRMVGEAEGGAEAVSICKKTKPHIALMEIRLLGMNGIEATDELRRHCPTVKVIILSMCDDQNSVVSAIRSGARAFVLKKASSAELLDSLRTVAAGGFYLSSQVSDRLLFHIRCGDLETRDRNPLGFLSPRELQVLRLVAEGKSSKEIAVLLNLRSETVRSYRKTMMKKLGVSNVAGLTQRALAAGLVTAPSAFPGDSFR
ncbi:MAG: response regulator [Bryobacteraceae bacterium]